MTVQVAVHVDEISMWFTSSNVLLWLNVGLQGPLVKETAVDVHEIGMWLNYLTCSYVERQITSIADIRWYS